MKYLIFSTLLCLCTSPFLLAQHYLVQGNNQLWDLKVSAQYNTPCGLASFNYSPNANTGRFGIALQHYGANGSISSESQYATNDPDFENIMRSNLVNLSNKKYLIASVVWGSASNTFAGGYVLLTILDPVNGNVLTSKAVEIPNAAGGKLAVNGVVLNGNTAYVVGVSAVNASNYDDQIFVVKASLNLTNNVITPNWVRSYYTPSVPQNGPLPSIAYDNETARLWVAQPDNTGKLLLFTLDASNGALLGQRIGGLPGTNIKEVKVAVVQVSKKVFSRCLITRSLNPAGNTHFTVAKLGVNNFGIPSIQTQKSYVLGGNWAMNSVDIQYPTMLVGTTKLLGAASKYNWLKFDMTNCLTQGNMSYTPNRQSGQSVSFGGGVFSVGTIGQPGNTQLVQMRTAATCETPLTIPVFPTTMTLNSVSISNGLNITSPTVRNVTLIKLNGISTTQQVCP
jgi:hypothetical protein